MFRIHCDRLVVKVIDAASIEGVFKSLRYNARRYPAVIVNRDTRFIGKNSIQSATKEIDRLLTGQEITANLV
jgi:hypothetical protein